MLFRSVIGVSSGLFGIGGMPVKVMVHGLKFKDFGRLDHADKVGQASRLSSERVSASRENLTASASQCSARAFPNAAARSGPLSPRGTSGERAGERGNQRSIQITHLLSPALSSFVPQEEREFAPAPE